MSAPLQSQAPAAMLQSWLQHWLGPSHDPWAPTQPQVCVVASHTPVQQSSAVAQEPPTSLHAHSPPAQLPLQQSLPVSHVSFTGPQAQVPLTQA